MDGYEHSRHHKTIPPYYLFIFKKNCVCVCVSRSVMSDSETPWSPGSSVHGILQARKRTYININRMYRDLFSSEFSKIFF